jgi:hypothetical protein
LLMCMVVAIKKSPQVPKTLNEQAKKANAVLCTQTLRAAK